MFQKLSSRISNIKLKQISALLVILTVAAAGTILLISGHAATPYVSINADRGTLTGCTTVQSNVSASDGQYVKFGGSSGCGGTGLATFTPSIIPISDPEIPNSMRGQYEWNGSTAIPSGWPIRDVYYRDQIHWNQIETSPGVYNFSIFDQGLARAEQQGGKFGFRITAFNPGFGSDLPSWTPTEPNNASFGPELMPDWNNTSSLGFLNGYTKLMSALANHVTSRGVKFADDPRLGFLDMGGYGNNGEWHLYMQTGAPITQANMDTMMQDEINDFPNKILLAMDDSVTYMNDALAMSPKVGIRTDCLGTDWGGGLPNLSPPNNSNPAPLLRWKTAPVVTEWCGGTPSNEFSLGTSQVAQYHISMLSSDNFQTPASDPAALATADKTAGYRYQIDSATLPSSITSGASFNLTSKWENVNVAPTYEPWAVQFELRNASGGVSWTGNSSLNLRQLLPTKGTPSQINDQLTIPSTVAKGTYTLAVRVIDPSGYLTSMNLANKGRTSDGAYPLGSITVK